MLAAYLRGLLKPELVYGVRSLAFEDLKIEMMLAQIGVEDYAANVQAEASLIHSMSHESKQRTLRRVQRQLQRRTQLQLMDVYDLASGGSRRSFETSQGRISLVQLFRLAQQSGILAAVDAHFPTPTK